MGINLSSNFTMNAALPLDDRIIQADLTARNAIPALQRYLGMTVYVTSEAKFFSLVGGVANGDWIEGTGGGSGTAVATSDKLKMIEALANSSTTTWLGDSITENANGYIRHLEALFSGNTFTNRAVGGHTSIDMVSTQLPLAVVDDAEHYVIAIGLNDIRYFNGVGGTGETTIAGYLANIKTATDALKATANSPSISVINIFPTYWDDQFTELKHNPQIEKTREWNDALEAFCETEGVNYIDVFNPIFDKVNAHNYLSLYADSVHPSSDLGDPTLDTGSRMYASAVLNQHATSTAEEYIPTGEHFFKFVMHDPETPAAGGYIGLRNIDITVNEDIGLTQNTNTTANLYGAFNPAVSYYNNPFEWDNVLLFSTTTYPKDGINLTSIFSGIGVSRGPKAFSTYYSKDPQAYSDPEHHSWGLVAQELTTDGVAVNILPPSRKGFYYKFQANGTGTLNMKQIDMGVGPVRVNFQNLTVAGLAPRFSDFFKGNLTVAGDGLSGNQPNYVITWEAPYELSSLDIEAFSGLTDYTIYRSFDAQALSDFSHPSWTNLGSGTQNGSIKLEKLGIGAGSTGILSGGVGSTGTGPMQFSISDGNGLVINTHDDANNPISTNVTWSGLTDIDIIDTGVDFTAVGIDGNGDVVQKAGDFFSPEEQRDIMVVATFIHQGGVSITTVSQKQVTSYGGLHSLNDLGMALGVINVEGNEYQAAATDLTIKRTVGSTFDIGSNYANNRKAPNELLHNEANPVSFIYTDRDGLGDWVFGAPTTNIETTVWDDGTGTPNTVNNTNWSVQRIFFFPSSEFTIIQRGQAEYSTLAQAADGVSTEAVENNPTFARAILRGFLLVRGNCTDLSDPTRAVFVPADKFGQRASGGAGTFIEDDNEFYIRQLETFRNESPAAWFSSTPEITISDETVNPIDGVRSALMTQVSAISMSGAMTAPLVFTDDIMKEKRINACFEYDAFINSGSFRVETLIWNGTTLRTEIDGFDNLITSSSKGTWCSEFYVEPDDIEVVFRILTEGPDDLNTMMMDNFRLDISPREVKEFTVTNSIGLSGNDGRAISSNVESIHFNGSGTGWTEGVDGSTFTNGNYYEVQYDNSIVELSVSIRMTANVSAQLDMYKNGVKYKTLSQFIADSAKVGNYISDSGEFVKGDKIAFGIADNVTLNTLASAHFLNIVETAQSSGTVFASDTNKEDIVVEGAGNAGETITANVTDIPFIEVSDNTSSWNGSQFTVPETGVYVITGGVLYSANVTSGLYLYVNGVNTGIGNDGASSQVQSFAYTRKVSKNDILSIRSSGNHTLLDDDFNHHISITKQSVNVDNLIIENFGTTVSNLNQPLNKYNSIGLSGNDGRTVTGATEDVPFNGSGTGWTGGTDGQPSFYTVQYSDSEVRVSTSLRFNTPLSADVHLYKNGSFYRVIGTTNTSNDSKAEYISSKGEFSAGDQLSVRSNTTGTLVNVTYHYLNIVEDARQLNIDTFVIENPEGEFETVENRLTTDDSGTGIVSELTFTGLEIGRKYLLTGLLYYSKDVAGSQDVINAMIVYNGASIIYEYFDRISPTAEKNGKIPLSKVFTATSDTVTFDLTNTTNSKLSSDGDRTFAQLTKLPKKLGVDQLGQVVTIGNSNGIPYPVKGKTMDGAQVYEVCYKVPSTLNVTGNITTIQSGLVLLGATQESAGLYVISNHNFGIPYNTISYTESTGSLDFYAQSSELIAGTYIKFECLIP